MTEITDAVIIGSGALGCATAFALVEAGVRRLTVIDRGPLVSGMTRRNAGLVHTYQPDVTTMRLAQSSLDIYRHWATLIGGACGFVETGTIVTAANEEEAARLRERCEWQTELGIDAQAFPPEELAALFPQCSFRDVQLGTYEPGSGYVDSVLASQGLARRAREKGARFETGSLVKQIGQERGRVTHLVTTTGNIQTPLVIIAAGAGAERLLMPLGVNLNLVSRRGAIGFFDQPLGLHEAGHPTFVDADSTSFIRPHAFHLSTAGMVDHRPALRPSETLDEIVSGAEAQALASLAAGRVPMLEEAPLKRAHAILYDRLPDGLPALGPVPGFEGLYVLAGLGESAIAAAPAAGRALAEMVVDSHSQAGVEAFRLNRSTLKYSPRNQA